MLQLTNIEAYLILIIVNPQMGKLYRTKNVKLFSLGEKRKTP